MSPTTPIHQTLTCSCTLKVFTVPIVLIGDLYAVGSALAWSFALILMRVAGRQVPPIPLTF